MKNLFLVIFLISRIIYGENIKGRAWAKVEVLNKKIIIGEPIYIKLTKYATPYAGDIYLDGKKCDDPYIKGVEESSYYYKDTKAEGIKIEEKVKETSFNILNNCNLMMKDMEEREYEVCYKDEWLSACDRFSIEYPKGKDLEVFEKMGKEARDFTFPESKIKPAELLEKYPTSTYAGWLFPEGVWRGGVGVLTIDKKDYEIDLKILEKILNGIEIKEIVKELYGGIYIIGGRFNEEKFEKEIEGMKKIKEFSRVFTDANPDFSFAGYILAIGGYNALHLGEFNQACDMLKRSIGMKWQKPYIKKEDYVVFLKEVIKLLEEKGFCK